MKKRHPEGKPAVTAARRPVRSRSSLPLRAGLLVTVTVLAAYGPAVASRAATGEREARRPGVVRVATWPVPDGETATPIARADPAASASWACPTTSRALGDRPDLRSGPLVHVVYLVAADAPDEGLDTNGTLDCSVRAQNEWLKERSAGLRWRIDTYLETTTGASGVAMTVETVDVTFVRSTQTMKQLRDASSVTNELRLRGFNERTKRYLTYVAGGDESSPCGDAWYPLVQRRIPPISDTPDGKYAQVYLFSAPDCRARDFGVPGAPSWSESIAQQELMHNDALVPIGAPHGCGPLLPPFGHVCTPGLVFTSLDPERVDVMFPFATGPLSDKVLDRGRDDYFSHRLPLARLEESPYIETAP